MRATKAAVVKRSDPKEVLHREGRVMHERFMPELDAVVRAASGYSRKTVGHLRTLPPETQAAFIKGMIEEGGVLFQPWAMEILYVLGLQERARFTELQRLLGVSSRTLSDKLQALREQKLVERTVFDDQSVRGRERRPAASAPLAERTEGAAGGGVRRTSVRIEYFLTKRGQRTAVLGAALFADFECEWRS